MTKFIQVYVVVILRQWHLHLHEQVYHQPTIISIDHVAVLGISITNFIDIL